MLFKDFHLSEKKVLPSLMLATAIIYFGVAAFVVVRLWEICAPSYKLSFFEKAILLGICFPSLRESSMYYLDVQPMCKKTLKKCTYCRFCIMCSRPFRPKYLFADLEQMNKKPWRNVDFIFTFNFVIFVSYFFISEF